jgi:hypothetical protein
MALTRITCPECGAGLKSGTGFTVGQAVECPKCETAFTVEEPDDAAPVKKPVRAVASRVEDDEPDDRPRKKKKKRRDDEEDDEERRSYKNSPLRYAILGVLVVVMVVLGVMLILKKQREREEARAEEERVKAEETPRPIPNRGPMPGGPPGPGFGQPGFGQPGFGQPGFPNTKGGPNVQFPKNGGPGPGFNQQAQVVPLGGGLLGSTPPAGTPQAQQLTAELSKKLVGTWAGTAPDGSPYQVEYRADGTYSGGGMTGKWQVAGLVGTRGLKLTRGGPAPVRVVFEDDELLHDTGKPGETAVLRKK